ncbi:MAG: tetratricopeptide repeat protein [Lentisphaeria bacterium]|nr:tetratricopeptide repeat protein [Lentisphaeria bacterium]
MKNLPAIFSGKTAAVIVSGVLLLTGLPAFCAFGAGSEDLLLGDKAYASGDYDAAERFYRKATLLLASPLWEKAALQLCRVCLKKGDVNGAYNTLREYQRRNPGKSAGVLSGMVLAADGNYDEAARAFQKVISSNSPERLEAIYQLASLHLLNGKYAQAAELFGKLADSPIPREKKRGLYGKIYALIRKGDTREAGKLLAQAPAKEKTVRQLKLLAQIKSGDLAAFKTAWLEERKKYKEPHPDKLLYEICRNGADLAFRQGDNHLTASLLQDSFSFASGDAERKDVMHRLFNLQSRFDHQGAVETIKRYKTFFPDAADKALLQIQCGRLLASGGRYKEAVALFKEIIQDDENLLDERRSAAYDAAVAAENGKFYQEAEKMHRYLISRSMTPAQKQLSEFRLGEFFLRRKNYAAAEKCFRNVLNQQDELSENARYMLLLTFVESNQPEKAKKAAARLITAKDPRHAASGRYQLARITELEGDRKKARELYLNCVKNASGEISAAPAAFAAARLAEQLGDPASAAREYMDFARKYAGDKHAAAALFFALRAGCFSDQNELSLKALALLKEKYPASTEHCSALLQLASHYFDGGDPEGAMRQLDAKPDTADANMDSAFSMLRARILRSREKSAEALQEAVSLLKKYPSGPDAARANLLCGNILADLGETKSALQYFRQAEKLHPQDLFGEVVSGRIADCLRDLYSGSEFDRALLTEAYDRYSKLASDSKLPSIRLQSLCKAARCRELAKDFTRAAELYEKVLYLAQLLKSSGIQPDAVWCARAAYAGAKNAFRDKRPEKLVRAMRMIRLYEELELPGTGEDFAALRRELRNSYNLFKRKEQK